MNTDKKYEVIISELTLDKATDLMIQNSGKALIKKQKYKCLTKMKEEVSNCCSEPVFVTTDICTKCGEHCEIIDISNF